MKVIRQAIVLYAEFTQSALDLLIALVEPDGEDEDPAASVEVRTEQAAPPDPNACDRVKNCVRRKGHTGVCTSAPSARTLDWDRVAEARAGIEYAASDKPVPETIRSLDLPAPPWADLLDEPVV